MNENKSLYRLGGIAAIASGVITQVSGALHPVETETIFQPAVHMKEVAENALHDPARALWVAQVALSAKNARAPKTISRGLPPE